QSEVDYPQFGFDQRIYSLIDSPSEQAHLWDERLGPALGQSTSFAPDSMAASLTALRGEDPSCPSRPLLRSVVFRSRSVLFRIVTEGARDENRERPHGLVPLPHSECR